MDRLWFQPEHCARDASNQKWACVQLEGPTERQEPTRLAALPPALDDKIAKRVWPSLAVVDFDIPYRTDGVTDSSYKGLGVVIDAERGLLIVDRDTVPSALGDIEITFGGGVRAEGWLVYLHPTHNFAVVGYKPIDPAQLPVTDIELAPSSPQRDDKVWMVGVDRLEEPVVLQTVVKAVEHLQFNPTSVPRFRETGLLHTVLAETEDNIGAVLVDRKGRLLGQWATFVYGKDRERGQYGISVDMLRDTVEAFRDGRVPLFRSLGVEVYPRPLRALQDRGLSGARARQWADMDPERQRMLEITRVYGGSAVVGRLRRSDLLLEIDGQPILDVIDLERASQADRVRVTVLRDGAEHEFDVDTTVLSGSGTRRMLLWSGLNVHEPHPEMAMQSGIASEGLAISWRWYGSPGHRYGVSPSVSIVEIDEHRVTGLDPFVERVRAVRDGQVVRLGLRRADGTEYVKTLRADLQHWPTRLFEWTPSGWRAATLDGGQTGD